MRDWLSLPLSSKSSLTEQDSTNKALITKENQNVPTLWSILQIIINGIGDTNHNKSTELVVTRCISPAEEDQTNNREDLIQSLEVAALPALSPQNEALDLYCMQEEDFSMDEDDHSVGLRRTHSSSSLASSTDTDNSTPASSQIGSLTKTNTPSANVKNVELYWNQGGSKVQVTGEFDNWLVSVDMTQDPEDPKRYIANIPMDSTKDVEFKFVVDGEWKYAVDLPHRMDWHGNINNVVYKQSREN